MIPSNQEGQNLLQYNYSENTQKNEFVPAHFSAINNPQHPNLQFKN